MYLLVFRILYFILLAILFIAAIWYRIDYKRKKMKRSKHIYISLFVLVVVGIVLGNIDGISLKPKFVSDNIAEATETILLTDTRDNIYWDFQAKVCAGTIRVERDISDESKSEIIQRGIDEKKSIYGYDGGVYYCFFSDRSSRSSGYLGLPKATGGSAWLISGNNIVSINYYYTSEHWFEFFIDPIFSSEYIYRDKIDLMDIANAERKNIRVYEDR